MATLNKIGNHKTSIYTDDSGFICVIYHNTAVVRFNQDKIILNSGGYQTNTTKTRMNQTSNQFKLDFTVYQKDFTWFVDWYGCTFEFEDNMQLDRVIFGAVYNENNQKIERIK